MKNNYTLVTNDSIAWLTDEHNNIIKFKTTEEFADALVEQIAERAKEMIKYVYSSVSSYIDNKTEYEIAKEVDRNRDESGEITDDTADFLNNLLSICTAYQEYIVVARKYDELIEYMNNYIDYDEDELYCYYLLNNECVNDIIYDKYLSSDSKNESLSDIEKRTIVYVRLTKEAVETLIN